MNRAGNIPTVCGVDCEKSCRSYQTECAGCNKQKGKVPWVAFIGESCCPIYQCVDRKGFRHCGQCPDIPCKIWLVDTRNPSVSDEQFYKDIQSRLETLKAYQG